MNITYSSKLNDTQFAHAELIINNEKKVRMIVNNSKEDLIRKISRDFKNIKNIHVRLITIWEKVVYVK